MMAIEKSNDGLSPPPKLLISHGQPVLSGSSPQVVRNHPGSTTTPTTPQKRQFRTSPQHTQKTKKKKQKKKKKRGPREKWGEKKKEGAIFANPPSENPLVDEPLWEKARKAWPTATILNKIFEFSEIYICQKY